MTVYTMNDVADPQSATGENHPKVFTDGSTYFATKANPNDPDKALPEVKTGFGRRLSLLMTTLAFGDNGWSKPRSFLKFPSDPDLAVIAPIIINQPVVYGGNEVEQTLIIMDGRAIGLPSPVCIYQWYLDDLPYYLPSDAKKTPHPSGFREVFKRPAEAVGRKLSWSQSWKNSATGEWVTATGVVPATVPRGAAPTTGTIVRVANASRGTGDGTSWPNAMGFAELTRAIVVAQPAGQPVGEVHVEAQNGPITAYANVRAGGVEGAPVTIRGVNSATGKKMKFIHDGGRGPLTDAGKYFIRPQTQGGGFMRMHHAYSNFTINPANDIAIVATPETWHALLTGSRVRLTTTGTLPAGLALGTDYFIIKSGTNQQSKFATSAANAAAGTAIDVTDAGTGVHTLTAIAATRNFTANAADETLIVDPLTYAEVRTGQLVWLSNVGGALPAPLLPDRPYCVIKSDTPNVIRLSGSTRGACMTARVAADPATDQINFFPGANSRFSSWFVTGDPCIFRSTDVLPAPLVAGTVYYALRSGAGGRQEGTFKVSATAGGPAIDITSAGSGTHTIEGPVSAIKLSDAGTGAHGIRLGHTEVGPNYLNFQDMVVQNGGPGGSINFATTSKGVKFEDIDADNLYRFIENSGYLGTSSGDASIIDMVVRNVHGYGFERSFSRLRYSSLDILFEQSSCDSRRVFGDPFASLFSLEPTSFTAVAGLSNACGPCRVTYSHCKASRAFQDAGVGAYNNGDGFEDNGATFGSTYDWTESDWHTDGAYDTKGTCNVFSNFYGGFSKRIMRSWGKGQRCTNGLIAQFQRYGEPYGENGSGYPIGCYTVNYPEDGSLQGSLFIENCRIEEFTGVSLVNGGADYPTPNNIYVLNHTISRRPNSPISDNIVTTTLTFEPPITAQGPILTSPSSFAIEKSGPATTVLTFDRATKAPTIFDGADAGQFTLSTSAPYTLAMASRNYLTPQDSDQDNTYNVRLRVESADSTNFTLPAFVFSYVAVLPTVDNFLYDDGFLSVVGAENWELIGGSQAAASVQDQKAICTTTTAAGGVVRHKKVLDSSNMAVDAVDAGQGNWGSLCAARMASAQEMIGFRWQSNVNETGTVQVYKVAGGVLTLVVGTPNPVSRPLMNTTSMEVRARVIDATTTPPTTIDECRVLVNGEEIIPWTATGLVGAALTAKRGGLFARGGLLNPWIKRFSIRQL